jgi:hypothetical protein
MKNKKILGGLVVVAVLLSGTTVLYFAGVERAGLSRALAQEPPPEPVDPGGDCGVCDEPGAFCAVSLGMGGGCNDLVCCPPGVYTFCGTSYKQTMSFQEVGSNPCGSCWKYSTTKTGWCKHWGCGGSPLCNVACVPFGPPIVLTKYEPTQAGGRCLPLL